MKDYLKIYLVVMAITTIIAVMVGVKAGAFYEAGFTFGLANLIAGILFAIIGVFCIVAGSRQLGLDILAAGGLILLTGGIACSVFPLSLH